MPQEFSIQEAIKTAIQAKKTLRDFYQQAARLTLNKAGQTVFERLAGEVSENIFRIFPYYQGDDLGSFEDFMAAPPSSDSPLLEELRKAHDEDIHERKARELALHEEELLEMNFRKTAERIIDPAARSVFEKAAEETRNHYQVIESEYAHTMGMVHETEIDTYVRE